MLMMVKQTERRTDRCFLPVGGNSVTLVQFPSQRRPPSSLPPPAQARLRVASGEDGETDAKRIRISGSEEALTNRETSSESCDQTGTDRGSSDGEDGVSPADGVQTVALESSEDNRAAEMASAGSLKVTIQRSSESREFGEKESSSERVTCHICHCSCPTAQSFQLHMDGAEHRRRLLHITQSVAVSQDTRGRRGAPERWCDVCESHFAGDVILHRRSKEHKESKKSSCPFCSVCLRHFRTPRKFVEHMKSPEHKQQVQSEKAQDEEMITVDAVGCFESESETPFTSGAEEGGDGRGRREPRRGDEEPGRGVGGEDGEGTGREEGGGEVTRRGRGGGEERAGRREHFSLEEDAQRGGKEARGGSKEAGDKELGRETEGGDSEDIGDTEGGDAEEVDVQTEELNGPQELPPADGDSYVVPVSGFFCRLCRKFFFKEAARDQHRRSPGHLSRVLQIERQRRPQPTRDTAELSRSCDCE